VLSKILSWSSTTSIFLVLWGAAACGPAAYVPVDPVPESAKNNQEFNRQITVMAAASVDDAEYRIGPEDLLEVTLFDIEDAHGEPRIVTSRVSNSGYATFPYVGLVAAAGYTPTQFEELLKEQYKRFIHEPQLTVLVQEYRSYRISVIGYVNTPGVLELKGRKTILEGLAMAGGLTDEAGKDVRLTRVTADGTVETILVDLHVIAEEGDPTLNVDLLPGDVVAVPKAGTFYVEGIVKNPGAYPLLQETTVSQAVATAGGPDPTLAKSSGTVLYRKSPDGERQAIPINLAALQDGEGEDFRVQEDDVIVVPLSTTRLWFDRLTTGILRVGVNAPLY
jgi:polysaccharide export outer membrane protein